MTRLDLLSTNDRLFLDVETDANVMNVAACLVFDGRELQLTDGGLDLERIEKHFDASVRRHRRYRQRLGRSPIAHRPIWIDDPHFKTTDHVRHAHLDSWQHAGALEDVSARFASGRFDLKRPLWEALIVDGLPGNRFAIVVKAHHCLADGVGGMDLLKSLLTPHEGTGPALNLRIPRTDPVADEILDEIDTVGRALEFAKDCVRSPSEHWRSIRAVLAGLAEAAQLGIRPATETLLDGENSSRRSLRWLETDLDRISQIRRARGGTLNDVVVTTVALALGRYLESHGFSREEQARNTFRVAIPVDTRSETSQRGFGNDISMMFAEVPVGDADPLRMLDRTREATATVKDSKMTTGLRTLMNAASRVPRAWVEGVETWFLSRHPANIVLTNIRGPQVPLSLLGAPLEQVIPIVPLMPDQALAVAVASYAGSLYWGLHADAARVTDAAKWARCVEDSFEDLWIATTTEATRAGVNS